MKEVKEGNPFVCVCVCCVCVGGGGRGRIDPPHAQTALPLCHGLPGARDTNRRRRQRHIGIDRPPAPAARSIHESRAWSNFDYALSHVPDQTLTTP